MELGVGRMREPSGLCLLGDTTAVGWELGEGARLWLHPLRVGLCPASLGEEMGAGQGS